MKYRSLRGTGKLEGNFLEIVCCYVAMVLCYSAQNNGVKVLDIGWKYALCWYTVVNDVKCEVAFHERIWCSVGKKLKYMLEHIDRQKMQLWLAETLQKRLTILGLN